MDSAPSLPFILFRQISFATAEMVRFTTPLVIISLVAGGFCTTIKRTASQIIQDITTLNSKALQMGASIDAFVTPSIPKALAVHAANGQLNEYLGQAIAHAQGTSELTLLEARDVVNLYGVLSNNTVVILTSLRTKVALVHQLALNGAVALVHGDVVASDKALGKYVDVMKPIILDESLVNTLVSLATNNAVEFAKTATLFT